MARASSLWQGKHTGPIFGSKVSAQSWRQQVHSRFIVLIEREVNLTPAHCLLPFRFLVLLPVKFHDPLSSDESVVQTVLVVVVPVGGEAHLFIIE